VNIKIAPGSSNSYQQKRAMNALDLHLARSKAPSDVAMEEDV
jgi:hypothetical protein